MKVSSRIQAYTLTSGTPKKIQSNPKRVGLLIQNQSANTLYLMQENTTNTTNAIQIAASNIYHEDVAPQFGFNLDGSGVIVIQENCLDA